MLIRSITLENFLPFQGKQRVEFSVDPERNVTLLMGNNGAGKTSLAQAFEWCFYGRAPKDSPQVINAFVRDHIMPGSSRVASVAIELEKSGKNYTVLRRQLYSRSQNGSRVKAEQQEFGIMYKEGGETRQVPAADRTATINTLLSSELSHYFFFDGEHVKNMRAEIEVGKSKDFAEAVKTILGLQPIDSAMQHLKATGNRLSVERWFRNQFDIKGDQNLEEKSRRISTLEKSISRYDEDILDAEAEEGAAKANVEKYRQLLLENQESEDAQRQVNNAIAQQKRAKIVYEGKRDALFKRFRTGYYRFLVSRLINDARNELADQDKVSKGVPSVNDKTIKFILERHECICGTRFETGDDLFQHLSKMLEYVPPKDLGTYISEFLKECRLRTEGNLTFAEDMEDAYREFAEAERGIMEADAALSSAQAYLASINHVDVSVLRKNLKIEEDARSRAAGKVGTARTRKAAAVAEIATLRSEIESYSVRNQKNNEVRECLAYVSYIYDFLDAFYSEREITTRQELESVVNKFFTEMYDGELHLELDENYGVTVKVDNIDTSEDAWKTSSGQTLAIILAFILGILDIAKENIQRGDTLLQGDTYPLVMDAPLSDFDKTRIGTICNLLPRVAEQVIIIIKDTDGELAEKHMASRIGKRYTIARIRDYESEIKE